MMELHRPRSLAELVETAQRISGRKYYLAGGTDFAVQRRAGALADGHVILLRGLPELTGITESGRLLRIGAATTIASLAASVLVRDRLPLLAQSLERFASPQIRSMATLGGNICNGSPTADTVPPLLVLEAEVELASASGTRSVPLSAFFTGYKRNALRDAEILSAVLVRAGELDSYRIGYRKVGARATMAIAKLSVAMAARHAAGPRSASIDDLRLAVGSLNEYPRRLRQTETLMRGAEPRSVSTARLAEAVRSEITPISDFRSDASYRESVCIGLIRELLRQSAVPE
jgi:CO/xanthine dehydrogenase FAD-binding subunit